MLTASLLFLAAVLVALGLAGVVLPAMPGAPLLFLGLVVAAWAEDFQYIGMGTLAVLAALAALTYVVDIAAGALGARHFGASPRAMLGAGIGAVVGLFFGLPGIVLGPFVGACIGELSVLSDLRAASRAGIGATVGLVLAAAVNVGIAVMMIGIYAFVRLF